MAFMDWHSSCSVNIKHLDKDHQHLMMLINALYEAMRMGKAKNIMVGLFRELEKYAETHFKNEEEFTVKHQYHEMEDHQIEHREFIRKIGIFQQKLINPVPMSNPVSPFLASFIVFSFRIS